ncbi:Hypothetical protein, putative [Bodo saltans]|uniref:Uncharacterized protein n=1 Tax=Bodo saltans TaxID=75058 RepID=A0A0S4IS73_BODSA|nr:Hypothetical protein, putative [Bodo saltans]|eukprot:CUF58338.1 Hypothetical protein, putative [Bodo saltans]
MRGNRYSRGGDPMKSKAILRKEKRAKLEQTGRVKRLRTRLRGIRDRSDKKEGNHHTTALMESFVTRRKEERAAEKKKKAQEEAAAQQKELQASGVAVESTVGGNKRKRDDVVPHKGQQQQQQRGNVSASKDRRPSSAPNQHSKSKMPISHRAPVSRGLY